MRPKALVAVFVTIFLLAVGLAADGQSAETKVIDMGWTGGSNWTSLPYQVAVDRKFFEKEGLNVRLITMRGTALMLSALIADEIDYLTILPFIAGGRGPRTSCEDSCIGSEIQRLCDYFQPRDQ
jgi:ABC-type nitrate/sulfonate/bicarbonate transport system substrate-binding protein